MKTYELNGAGARQAMLWFLRRERLRHYQDIEAIEKDIEGLLAMGTTMPSEPSIGTFITVPGVQYDQVIIPEPIFMNNGTMTSTDQRQYPKAGE